MDGLPVLEAHLQGYGRTRDRTGDNCHRVLRQIPSLFGRMRFCIGKLGLNLRCFVTTPKSKSSLSCSPKSLPWMLTGTPWTVVIRRILAVQTSRAIAKEWKMDRARFFKMSIQTPPRIHDWFLVD